MNKLAISLALVALTNTAWASKSRVEALQGANFLKDTQTIFENPAHINSLGQYLTLEMGSQSSTATTRSEGGFMRKDGAWNYGAYLGHQNETQQLIRSSALAGINGGGSYLGSENPFEVFFGTGNWGASVGYSNSNQKSASKKEQSLYGRFGMVSGTTEFYGTLEVLGSAKDGANKLNSGPILSAGFEKDMGRFYGGAEILYGQFKGKPANDENSNMMGVNLTLNDMSLRTADRIFYYGATLSWLKVESDGDAWTTTNLPVHVGIEQALNSYFVLRGSVQQTILIGSTKNEFTPTSEDTLSNNTTVAIGLGAKYNNFTLDGTLAGSTTGDINGNDVLTRASLTYNF